MPKQLFAGPTPSELFHLPPTLFSDTNVRHLCCFSTLFISHTNFKSSFQDIILKDTP